MDVDLRPAGAALLSPQQGRHLSSPLVTETLQPNRGDTMYLSCSIVPACLTYETLSMKVLLYAQDDLAQAFSVDLFRRYAICISSAAREGSVRRG